MRRALDRRCFVEQPRVLARVGGSFPLARVVEVGVAVGEGHGLGRLGDDVVVCKVFDFFSFNDVDFGGRRGRQ